MVSKKQKEKRKDFVKQKLKVGKVNKPANQTDTSFKAKSINIAGTKHKDFTYYTSLLHHHSSSTRTEVLNHLVKNLPSDASALKKLVSSVIPLINDESKDVRQGTLTVLTKLLQVEPSIIKLNDKSLILVIHSSMNHINSNIRNFSVQFLSLIVNHFPENLINLYFTKTLDCFFNLMNWSSTNRTSLSKPTPQQLMVFKTFLNVLLTDKTQPPKVKYHGSTNSYLIPTISEPYNSLNLFGVPHKATDLAHRKHIIGTHKEMIQRNLKNIDDIGILQIIQNV